MDTDALVTEALDAVSGSDTPEQLDGARVRYLGRKSELKQALRAVRSREIGMALNAARERIEQAVAEREAALERAELDRALGQEQLDITLPGEAQRRGRLHVITQVRREVEDIFLGMGYEVVEGREVETTRYL
ncbi:MAG TPA: hypothetical protein VKA24_01300, partial [Gaiellaceae bacterium]|nr:hypothetical protein [Gaiellaceae bacterium]